MSESAPVAEYEAAPLLQISRLNAFYGSAQALEDVTFAMGRESVAIVGRNGMGKTTLCNAIMGISPPRAEGSIRFRGDELVGVVSHKIARKGIGYVPQGRRLFPSLTVDQHLRIAARKATTNGGREWTRERVYELFRASASASGTGVRSSPGGSSRCSPSVGRSPPTQRSSSWTSRPRASLLRSSKRSSRRSNTSRRKGSPSSSSSRTSAWQPPLAERQLVMIGGQHRRRDDRGAARRRSRSPAPVPRRRAAVSLTSRPCLARSSWSSRWLPPSAPSRAAAAARVRAGHCFVSTREATTRSM